MITKETIKNFFEEVDNGDEFDTSEILLWGYFFLDSNLDNLKKLGQVLVNEDYKFVDIFEAEKENENDIQEYYLHIEKIEHHTVDSLHKRNVELYSIAEKYKVDSYDGFDIGNIINSEHIIK